MTPQEIYDAALLGIRKQGRFSTDGLGVCMYRGPEGIKCAAGHVLTDEEVAVIGEGWSIIDAQHSIPEQLKPHVSLLQELQRTHDEAAMDGDWASWELDMTQLAKRHGLRHTPKDEFEEATARGESLASSPFAVARAKYEASTGKIALSLKNGDEYHFAPANAQGLERARPEALVEIEVSPSGQGLYFPALDVDLWVPGLFKEVLER